MAIRRFRKSLVLSLLAAGIAAITLGCSGANDSSTSAPGHTLRTAFSADPGSLDPDVFYGGEGLAITLSVYEGLVEYENSSTEVAPALAEGYDVSDDGLVYTFRLRRDVAFHDGAEMTSHTWKENFERRSGVGAGPAYMLADVASVETPEPLTLVVRLRQPVSAFLDYLASPYGPKAISPNAIESNATQEDPWAEGWLGEHGAGTGPYQLSSVVAGQSYVLTAFPDYWGEQPEYESVSVRVMDSFTSQELALQSGELDIMLHGVSRQNLESLRSNPAFQVVEFPSIMMMEAWLNIHREPFADRALRLATASAIDRQQTVSQVFSGTATLAEQMYPSEMLAGDLGVYDPTHDPSVLRQLVVESGLDGTPVDIAYTTDDPDNAQVAELVAQQLSNSGLSATTRGVTQQVTFAWPTNETGRADMVILPASPDHADPSAWATLFYAADGGLNWLQADNNPEADALVQAGLTLADPEEAVGNYAEAADLYRESGDFIPLANIRAVVVARAGISGWAHDYSTGIWTVRLEDLQAGE